MSLKSHARHSSCSHNAENTGVAVLRYDFSGVTATAKLLEVKPGDRFHGTFEMPASILSDDCSGTSESRFQLSVGRRNFSAKVPVTIRRLQIDRFLRLSFLFPVLDGQGTNCDLNFFVVPDKALVPDDVFQIVRSGDRPRPGIYLKSGAGETVLHGRLQSLLAVAPAA